jgi:hypothetical protein
MTCTACKTSQHVKQVSDAVSSMTCTISAKWDQPAWARGLHSMHNESDAVSTAWPAPSLNNYGICQHGHVPCIACKMRQRQCAQHGLHHLSTTMGSASMGTCPAQHAKRKSNAVSTAWPAPSLNNYGICQHGHVPCTACKTKVKCSKHSMACTISQQL